MGKIYTIGFVGKTAEDFFEPLKDSNIDELVDVRLHNRSQLDGITKISHIPYLVGEIVKADYYHDLKLAPSKSLFDSYKDKVIDWEDYEREFEKLMRERRISEYIAKNYSKQKNYCLLCAEPSAENCHRRLVAEKFAEVFSGVEIIHL